MTQPCDAFFPEDEHLFDDYSGLESFLKDNGLPISGLSHEEEHAEKARRLGFTPKYGVVLCLTNDGNIGYMPFVRTAGYIDKDETLAISSNPSKASELDKSLGDKIERRFSLSGLYSQILRYVIPWKK